MVQLRQERSVHKDSLCLSLKFRLIAIRTVMAYQKMKGPVQTDQSIRLGCKQQQGY